MYSKEWKKGDSLYCSLPALEIEVDGNDQSYIQKETFYLSDFKRRVDLCLKAIFIPQKADSRPRKSNPVREE